MAVIILPVDFGKTTDKLVEGAVKLGFSVGDLGMQYIPEIEENEIKQELLEINALEQRIVAQGVDCEHLLKQGIAKEMILEYAKEKKADYIVMGSHGRSGLYDVFIGSLTKELTKLSPIPVLVIPCHE